MPFTCACSAAAARDKGTLVWGTDVYMEQSDLCRAAVHAGAITTEGGPVSVTRAEGQELYAGSSRNGVTTHEYGSAQASIRFK
jgi:hypothetical protein